MAESGRLDPAVWVMTLSGRRENPQPSRRLRPREGGRPIAGGVCNPPPGECAVTPAWRLVTPFAIGTSIFTAARTARAADTSAGIACICVCAGAQLSSLSYNAPGRASFDANSSSVHSTTQLFSCNSTQHYSIWLGEHNNTRPKKASACQVNRVGVWKSKVSSKMAGSCSLADDL